MDKTIKNENEYSVNVSGNKFRMEDIDVTCYGADSIDRESLLESLDDDLSNDRNGYDKLRRAIRMEVKMGCLSDESGDFDEDFTVTVENPRGKRVRVYAMLDDE
jgi:hypothetical protein